ncbi:hypothetical protein CBP34_12690 [Acidovorax carolinensis]|uniref:Glycosyltransferase n=1 Tax=Acidovorax carolinensis TaxID=553814 RepID=A0A240U4H0_9BURK|nr:hypothetical protein [Acidovorax carolinensis]ART52344.1 hypothetical protein CBP34_12690 [Acidovorax carolinensis]
MNSPTPAIVTQKAARPLPRWALLLLCLAYVVPGFVGRGPWKNADVAAFGYMMELANGHTAWLRPQLGGMPPETDGLLPYWLGAWAIQITPDWLMAPEMAARLPFMALLVLTLAATWYGVYYLARSPGAQPVAFAFGGEANPSDYARAIADGALLALIACLGLAQLSHEATGYLAQLACAALIFFAVATLPYHTVAPAVALVAGMVGLTLAGAPTIAALLGAGSVALVVLAPAAPSDRHLRWAVTLVVVTVLAAVLAWQLDLWRWRLINAATEGKEFRSLLRLLLWFGWPAWPMATWTLWRWRKQLFNRQPHRHLWLPLWFSLVSVGATFTTQPADRALLVGLPAIATLAAFALPTFRRSMAALIDWFTLLFFSVSALAIWVIWFAMQTGVPAQPAANVAKLAPGFTPTFSWLALVVALAASAAWCRLVWWRAARNRTAIWKSLVLPASGAALCWLLLTTLWLPLLDYARSYVPQARKLSAALGPNPGCVQMLGLSRAQMAALQYHAQLRLQPATQATNCPWLVVDNGAWPAPLDLVKPAHWTREATIGRPTDKNEFILLFRRTATPD